MRPRLFLLVTAVVGLAGACGPSVDPAFKADLDRRLAALPTSEETYPPSESYLPMTFGVGQWTQHRIRDVKGLTTLLTSKLVGQENGGYWLETVTESYQGREAVKMDVALLTGRDTSGMEIRALKIKKGNAAPTNVDPGDLPAVRERYRSTLDLLAVAFGDELKDDAHVPAGRFIGCYKAETGRPWGPFPTTSILCAHPCVPLSGVVRAHPVDKSSLMELVAFGITGAESEF